MQPQTGSIAEELAPGRARGRPRIGLVQDRPTLGSLRGTGNGLALWLLPAVDLASASVAVAAVILAGGSQMFPALPVAPLVLVIVNAALDAYGTQRPRESPSANEEISGVTLRLMTAVLLTWSASLLTDFSTGAELALCAGFLLLNGACLAAVRPLRRRLDQPERWVLVADEGTAERLRAYEPLRDYAQLVATLPPPDDASDPSERVAALDIVERYSADRVVIATAQADDESLLDLLKAFRSVGVAVSLLPRPLDLLEAPAAVPSKIGGVPLIEVDALATRRATPYLGPDRRSKRRTRVSVVVPTLNEEQNVGLVLNRLPDDLHEVILVDGNSHDNTVEAARRAYPRHPGPDPERARQGGRAAHRVRGGHRESGRDARRRRLCRPGRDTALRRCAGGRRRLRQGLALPRGRRQRRHHTDCGSLGNCFLSGTANLLHGTHFTDLCYGYNAFWARCLPVHLPRCAGLRGRDADQPAHGNGRDEDHRGAELRGRPDLRAEQPQDLPRRVPGAAARSSREARRRRSAKFGQASGSTESSARQAEATTA